MQEAARRYRGKGNNGLLSGMYVWTYVFLYTVCMYVCVYIIYTHTSLYIYRYTHTNAYIYICIHIMAVNKFRESSAKVAAKGRHFYAKVLTSGRSQIGVILNNQ